MNNIKRLSEIIKEMNNVRHNIDQTRDSADYYYENDDMKMGEAKMLEVDELESNLSVLETEHTKLTMLIEQQKKAEKAKNRAGY